VRDLGVAVAEPEQHPPQNTLIDHPDIVSSARNGHDGDVPEPVDLDTAADRLYAAPREEFTPLRTELAKAAKAAGETETAAAIGKLAKPTTSAWLANQVARDPDSAVDELADLGDAFRQAHANLAGADLKSLSQKRSKLVATLVRQAASVNGAPLTEAVTRELEDVFTTAIANADVARVVLAGRLTTAKDLAAAAAQWPTTSGEPAPRPVRTTPKRKPERDERQQAEHARKVEAARERLAEAKGAVKEAEADRAEEERILADAERAADAATDEVRRIYEELDAAEAREKEARRRVGSAARSVKDAERRASQAWRAVQQAEAALEELG
jgi:hypothetical protein